MLWRDCFPVRQARVRPLAAFALMALAGTIAAWLCRPSPALCLGLCGCAGGALLACGLMKRPMLAAALALGLCLGMARMTLALARFPVATTVYSVPMTGKVISEPWLRPDTGRLIFKFRLNTVDGAPDDRVVRLYLRGDAAAMADIRYGQTLSVTGNIWASDPVTNPYQFDFGAWLHRNGLNCIATAKIEDAEVLSEVRDFRCAIIDLRDAVGRRIDALFPQSAPLVRALVLGDRSMIGDELRQSLNATGTAHLISISGLHVTVLALALSLLLSRFMPRRWANLATLGPLILYGTVIGWSAPFTRALVMFAIFSFAPLAGLPSDGLTRLAAALLVWLAARPLDIGDGGFILSFAASAGILLLLPPILRLFRLDRVAGAHVGWRPWRRFAWRVTRYFATLLCASMAAQLATLPAVVACFGAQSVVSLPYNLVCVPLFMAGYMLAAAALTVSWVVYPLGAVLARLGDPLLGLLLNIARASRALPVTSVHIGRYPAPLALLHAALALAASDLCAIRRNIRKYLPLALVGLAGLSCLITWLGSWPFAVKILDADQANCAILTTRGHTYVFDVGDTYSPAADYLSATCLHLDGVFLSHPHEDHAGGLSDLLTAFRPDVIYVPDGWFDCGETADSILAGLRRAGEMNIPIVELLAGQTLSLSDEALLTVYNPVPDDLPGEVNDISLVLGVECDGHGALFTGDVTMEGEPLFLPDMDLLHVPHHGASNATSDDLLQMTTPEYALISVGENNFGHPAPETLDRIADSGARVLRTDRRGAIFLTLKDGAWQVKTFLEAPDELE